jgi:hypothetical protein
MMSCIVTHQDGISVHDSASLVQKDAGSAAYLKDLLESYRSCG